MIGRHTIDIANIERFTRMYVSSLSNSKIGVEAQKAEPLISNFGSLSSNYLRLITESLFLNRSISESYTHLFYAHQFGVNTFKIATHDGEPLTLTIGDNHVQVVGKGTRDYIDFGSWMNVITLAFILRDDESKHFLRDISNDFMKTGAVSYNELRIAEVNVYKAMVVGDLKNAIADYWKAEKLMDQKDSFRPWVNYSSIPYIKVLESIVENEQVKFDHELEEALILHKKHYGSPKNQSGSWGWISFPLLMVCAYAYDHGMKINIESDYIPRWLVEGDFKDCELTVK